MPTRPRASINTNRMPSPQVSLVLSRIGLPCILQLVLVYLPVQGREPDIEQPRGFRLVPFGVVEDALDVQLFGAGQVEGAEDVGCAMGHRHLNVSAHGTGR